MSVKEEKHDPHLSDASSVPVLMSNAKRVKRAHGPLDASSSTRKRDAAEGEVRKTVVGLRHSSRLASLNQQLQEQQEAGKQKLEGGKRVWSAPQSELGGRGGLAVEFKEGK